MTAVLLGFGLILAMQTPSFFDLALDFALEPNVMPLAAIFCVVGPSWWWVRVGLTIFVVALFYALWSVTLAPSLPAFLVQTLQFVGVTAMMSVPRSLGWRLETPDAAAPHGRTQFTVRHLCGWTVGCALLCAAWLQLQRTAGSGDLARASILGLVLSMAPVALVWPAFDPQLNPIRWGLAALPMLGVGLGLAIASRIPGTEPSIRSACCWCSRAWCWASTWRSAGSACAGCIGPDRTTSSWPRLQKVQNIGRPPEKPGDRGSAAAVRVETCLTTG